VTTLCRLLVSLGVWAAGRLHRDAVRQKLRAFPVGSRVRVTGGCPCGEKFVGSLGIAGGLDSLDKDYRVFVDGHSERSGIEFLCAKSLERVS
jgi:hypothetical protein